MQLRDASSWFFQDSKKTKHSYHFIFWAYYGSASEFVLEMVGRSCRNGIEHDFFTNKGPNIRTTRYFFALLGAKYSKQENFFCSTRGQRLDAGEAANGARTDGALIHSAFDAIEKYKKQKMKNTSRNDPYSKKEKKRKIQNGWAVGGP